MRQELTAAAAAADAVEVFALRARLDNIDVVASTSMARRSARRSYVLLCVRCWRQRCSPFYVYLLKRYRYASNVMHFKTNSSEQCFWFVGSFLCLCVIKHIYF